MNNDDLVQNYFLKNIYNSLHDLYNHITDYITSDNSNLDNIVNFENYNLLISIINLFIHFHETKNIGLIYNNIVDIEDKILFTI